MHLKAARSQLLAVDMQERLMPAIDEADRVIRNAEILLQAAGALSLPVTLTEQYRKGLGPTVDPVLARLPTAARTFEKAAFSGYSDDAIAEHVNALRRNGRDQAVIFGV